MKHMFGNGLPGLVVLSVINLAEFTDRTHKATEMDKLCKEGKVGWRGQKKKVIHQRSFLVSISKG